MMRFILPVKTLKEAGSIRIFSCFVGIGNVQLSTFSFPDQAYGNGSFFVAVFCGIVQQDRVDLLNCSFFTLYMYVLFDLTIIISAG